MFISESSDSLLLSVSVLQSIMVDSPDEEEAEQLVEGDLVLLSSPFFDFCFSLWWCRRLVPLWSLLRLVCDLLRLLDLLDLDLVFDLALRVEPALLSFDPVASSSWASDVWSLVRLADLLTLRGMVVFSWNKRRKERKGRYFLGEGVGSRFYLLIYYYYYFPLFIYASNTI